MSGLITIPGMVDPHVHLRSMEWSHKGTFASETSAAVAGGYWAVFDMPNTTPATLDQTSLNRKLQELAGQAICDYGVYFCASATGNWHMFPDIVHDVCGIKMFNNSTTGDLLVENPEMREKHYASWTADKIFTNHAEGETCSQIVDLVRKYRKPTHILHISTAYEIEIIKAAKEEGLPITCGVCPHHLWLIDKDIDNLGSLGWMKPTLKTQKDQDALWNALQTGIIDIVESDHAPHTLAEKQKNPAPYGVPGLETTLPLLMTAVFEKRLTIEHLIELVAENPRRIWRLDLPGDTYTVVDFDNSYVIDNNALYTKCGWSPFNGMRVRGRVVETWIRGTKVYDGENVLVEQGFGNNLYA